MAKRPQKARRLAGPSNVNGWLLRHAQVSLASLGQLSRSPLPTMMTAAVLGIALALPAGLHLLLGNLQQLAGNLSGSASISLFLHQEVSDQRARELAEELRAWPQVSSVEVVERAEAMDEFRELSGFGEALEALEENPLPAVLIVEPAADHTEPAAAERLLASLRDLVEADIAQLDLQWVRRFAAFTEIARRGVLVLASLLALAVLLILGNTIRLEIQNRHAEIEISKLIGATDAFIRRPFLYLGLWYGLLGGIIAWLLVSLSLWALRGPVASLAGLYESSFRLSLLQLDLLLGLLGVSTLLGLAGSWLAVGRHLRAVQPD
jgi:cell division transport system permease protein